jgi:hypothetical protein
MRKRNIKRATVMEFGKLIVPSTGQSEYLQEEEIWGEDPVHYTQSRRGIQPGGGRVRVPYLREEERGEGGRCQTQPAQEAQAGSDEEQASLGHGQRGGGGEE